MSEGFFMKNNNMNNININITKIWLLLAVFILINVACKKDIVDDFTPVSERWEDVDQFLASVDLKKSFSIPNAEKEFVIEFEDDILHFEDDAFVDPSGVVITSEIKVEITRVISSGEAILNDLVTTTSDDEILYGKGLFKIEAFQNGTMLKMNGSKSLNIYIPAGTGSLDSEATFKLDNFGGILRWFPTSGFNVSLKNWDFIVNGINYKGSGYEFKVFNEGWALLANYEDLIYTDDSYYGNIAVTIPEAYNNVRSRVYIADTEDVCVISLEKQDNVFSHDRILIDKEMKVVFITTVDDELYYDQKHLITGEMNNFTFNPSKTDYIELYTNLKKL